jgi:hypothetical protein
MPNSVWVFAISMMRSKFSYSVNTEELTSFVILYITNSVKDPGYPIGSVVAGRWNKEEVVDLSLRNKVERVCGPRDDPKFKSRLPILARIPVHIELPAGFIVNSFDYLFEVWWFVSVTQDDSPAPVDVGLRGTRVHRTRG